MLAIDVETENELKDIAVLKGLSVEQLLHDYVIEARSELEAVNRADDSYREYQKTGQSITHEQMKANDLDS